MTKYTETKCSETKDNKTRCIKIISVIFLCVFLLICAVACGTTKQAAAIGNGKGQEALRTFTDSAGREVQIPERIEKIAVSGPLAQMYVFALCPDKLCGLAHDWSEEAKQYIDEKYYKLPKLGQLYGGKGDLNSETLLESGAQVIVDLGESKETIREDLDDIQNQVGIPAVHIYADLASAGDAFRKLGELAGMPEEAETLASFYEQIYNRTAAIAERVDKADILCLDGDLGQNIIVKGTFHSQVLDLLANNLAVVDNASGKGLGNEADMEQLLNWDPEYILFAPESIYSIVHEEPEWQNLQAIRNDNYYEIPYGPYNWMGTPPSCQRLLGMMWLEQLLYPEFCDYDLYEDAAQFYKLFYHTELTRQQYDALVENSVTKKQKQNVNGPVSQE